MSALFEQLEARQFFSATIVGVSWVNSAGETLANNTGVADDAVVTARIQTADMRGRASAIFLFEDDGIFGRALVKTIPFTVPTNSDTATVKVRLDWETDGIDGDPEFLLSRSALGSEPIVSRNLIVRRTNSVGAQVDANDTIGEAVSLGSLSDVRSSFGRISHGKDVDLYSFTAQAGQWVAFDVDSVDGFGLNSQLRVFNSAGVQLAFNDDGSSNTDPVAKAAVARETEPLNLAAGRSAFTHFVAPQAGTFFVGVSGGGNFTYNASNGGNDLNGASGAYSLTVTPLTRNTVPANRSTDWTGELRLANPEAGGWRESSVKVSLHLEGSAALSSSNFTWILTHGRVDDRNGWGETVKALDTQFSDDQILTLDWAEGAEDNKDERSGLEGSAWIPLVGQWAERTLASIGVTPEKTGLIGHSWGSYVSHEIATRGAAAGRGDVNSIVALDPANDIGPAGLFGLQYDSTAVSFRAHSGHSWAIYGNGLYGSADRAATADESFKIEYANGGDDLVKHSAPRDVFLKLLQNAGSDRTIFQNFRLDRLRSGAAGPWKLNAYDGKFEGVFKVDVTETDGKFTFKSLVNLKFKNATSGVESTVTP
jgi:pimeloyl-ACP methyl ester carboxylesterase